MFPKNKINIIYRLLCLISFAIVILFVGSIKSLQILFLIYGFLALLEKSFRNIELVILTLIILWLCYLLNSYIIYKIILILDYSFYFLDTSFYLVEEDVKQSENEYIRFSKNKKMKGSNNISAVYLTVHLGLLFLAILVG